HLIGYEVQKVLAAVDWFVKDAKGRNPRIAVFGWGEGGMIAFYAGALDPRIGAVGVSGYFGPREGLWREPIDRNGFGLLERYGDAEVASLIFPRSLVLETVRGPEVEVAPRNGGGPGRITTPDPKEVQAEAHRYLKMVEGLRRSLTFSMGPIL